MFTSSPLKSVAVPGRLGAGHLGRKEGRCISNEVNTSVIFTSSAISDQ